MKIPVILAVGAMAAGAASARNIDIPVGTILPVCTEGVSSSAVMFQAKGLASKMFAPAGVTIEWRSWNGCPADGIRISLSQHSRLSDHPHAYAYALPFEGTHIVLFWDRIEAAAEPRAIRYLTAHVLVHELTHILQGTIRHSETGVMKAVFTQADIGEMEFRPLPFAPEDLELIQSGLTIRQARQN